MTAIASAISDGRADPTWQEVAFGYRDFVQAYEQFKGALLAEIAREAPTVREQWAGLFG